MRAPPSYGVLCGPGSGLAVGAAVALAVRREARSPAAVVLHWGEREVSPRAPARYRARRLATALRDDGHRAWASGRLAFVALPEDPDDAAVSARRAAAAVGRAPSVLVVAGPRPTAIEALLAVQDGVVISMREEDDDLTGLAASGLQEDGPPATVVPAVASPVGRIGAVTGLWLAPRARRALAVALGDPW